MERAIGEIAGRQDNVITRAQLLATGLGRGAIAHRVIAGSLSRLHRGVYLVSYAPPTPTARAPAAVLACGDGAVLSHHSAAELWELLPAAGGDIDVSVAARNPGTRAGIRVHRLEALPPRETRQVRRIPIASPARTVCDVADAEPAREAERALAEARIRRLVTDRDLLAVIGRAPTRPGSAFVRALLERDRQRDQILVAAGHRVIRVTWRQLAGEPLVVIARIAQALGAGPLS